MPNTIAENLQRLVDARTGIASSITTKEGTVNTGDGFEEFPADILTIPSGGGGGTTDYNQLSNKPSINGVTLSGNKTTAELGIVGNVQADWNETDSTDPSYIQNKPNIPSGVVVDKTYNAESQNAQAGTAVAQAVAGKVDKVTGKGLSTNDFTNADKDKLDDVESGAQVNVQADWNQNDSSADDFIKNKPTIPEGVVVDQIYKPTSINAQSGVAVAEAVSTKVDKVTGKGLSQNDYTDADKAKLSSIESGAEENVQADWNQTDATADDFIKNKPHIPSGVVVDQTYSPTSTNAQAGVAVAEAISDKVDKVNGKGLSTNDFTDADKTKLDNIESGAEANVQSDWNQNDSTADDFIKNKPTIPAAQVNSDWDAVSGVAQILNKPTLSTVATTGSYNDLSNKPTIPTVNNATLEIQKNSVKVGDFSADASSDVTVNITVPVDAADVNALPDTTKYAASIEVSINNTTYVMTTTLKDQDGNTLGTAQVVDLPLETMVVGGSYDDTTHKIILTLNNGTTVDFSVADLVSGLQSEITSTNKLDADLVDDSTSTNKFVTAADKTAWNAKSDFSGSYNDLTDKPIIPAAQVNSDWNSASGVSEILNKPVLSTVATSGSYNDLADKPSIPAAQVNADWTAVSGVAQILNKPTLSTVATSGSYDDLSDKPTIPTVDQTYDSTSTNPQSGAAISEAIADKVDKVTGKGLSTNDYTNADKSKLDNIESGAQANVQSDWNQSDSSADDFIKNKPTISAVNDATLTIQKNGTAVGTFSANADTAATINITVPTGAADINALPATTKYGASIDVSIDSSTYVMTSTLKDQDGNTLGMPQTVDLPLETMVVGGSYDDATHKIILTLNNGTTVDFSVADLVSGLQSEITSTNKLDADLVDDTTSTHKFVTSADKAAWNAKSDFSGSYNDLTDKPTIPAAQVNADWNATSGVAQILNKPTIPTPVTVDQTYSSSSTNPQSGMAVAQAIASIPTAANKVDRDGDTSLSGTFAPSSDNGATLGTSTSRFGSVYAYRADYVYYTNNEITDAPFGMGGNFLLAPQSSVENAVKLDISDCFKFNIRDTPSRANMNIGSTTRYGGMWLSDGQGGGVTIYTDTEGSGVGNNYSIYLPHVTTYSGEHNVLALKSDIPTVTDASTTTKGIVQLSDSLSTTSSTTAATSTAAKTLNDNKVDRAGDASLSGTFAPTTDNGATLGTSSKRFDTVYGETADFEYYEIDSPSTISDYTVSGVIPAYAALVGTAHHYFKAPHTVYFRETLDTSSSNVESILSVGCGTINSGNVTTHGELGLGNGSGWVCLRPISSDVVSRVDLLLPSTAGTIALTSDIPTVPTINDASTTTKGIVQLSDSVSTTSSTTAATSTAVKTVNDSVANKVDKTGNNMLSGLFEPQSNNGAKLGSSSYKFSDVYTSKINGNTMPSGSGTIALTSDIPSVPTYYAGTGLTKSGNTFSVEGPETVTISVNGSCVSLDSQSVYKDPGTGWVYGTWRCTVTKAFSTSANTAIVAFPTGARLTTGQVPVQCYSTTKKTQQFYIAWLNVNIVRVFSSGVASSLLPAVGDVLVFSVGFFNKDGI